MPHTVHVVCDATEFDARVTVSEDALVLDLFAEAGLTDPMELLGYAPTYYNRTRPVAANILQPVTAIPEAALS